MAQSPNLPVPAVHVSHALDVRRGASASDPGPWVATLAGDRLPVNGLGALIESAAPGFAAEALQPVLSPRPHVHYLATASGSDGLMLSLSPRATRLLRCEHLLVRSEALVLQWLSDLAVESHPAHADPDAGGNGPRRPAPPPPATGPLRQFLPGLVRHGPASNVGHGEYVVTRPVGGTTVAALQPPLGKAERKRVDFQVGQLLRHISSQQSPNGKFGTAVAVLSPAARKRVAASGLDLRHDRWSDAFLAMLESALRDAEDFKVAIRYDAVRDHVGRFRRFLDAVTRPCLVVVDAGDDTNALVSPLSGQDGPRGVDVDAGAAVGATPRPRRASLHVTGIRIWSSCVFGDPLFASVLSRNASPEVWDGFKRPPQEHLPDGAEWPSQDHPLDDATNAEIRRLLYECHHAVTAIVREYCRRCNDSDDREMPARKRLTLALRTLDNMDDLGSERRPHPGGEVSPAKRPKPDDQSCGGK